MIPFGSQYHRPPTPTAEKWAQDFKTMQAHGFNTIRGWAMWSWLCPREGQYDFSELDRLCDLGKKHGIGVILLINIESAPAWLYKKWPDKTYISRLGRPADLHTVHNTAIGGHPGLCLDYPEVKEKALDYINALVAHFAGHPGLCGWEPHNEPLIEPSRYNHEVFCYCPQTTAVYRDWLLRRYGTIAALNKAWQKRYGAFDEVFPPPEIGNFGEWTDWRMFAIERLVEQDRWRIAAIRANDPQRPVLMHSRGGGDRRDIVCDGTDDWRLAALADKFGYANFPQGKTIYEHMLSGDICRSAAQGKEFWMHELQSGPFGIGLNRNNPFFIILGSGGHVDIDVAARHNEVGEITPQRLALWSWLPISQGAKGLLYWQFRTEQFGPEYGFNLVNLDGTPHPRLEMAGRIGALLQKHEPQLRAMQPEPRRVAIAYSPRCAMMAFFNDGNLNAYLASYLGANRLLAHCDFPLDVVRLDLDAVNDDLSRYDAIYLPLPLWLDRRSAAKLRQYVQGGGLLVSEPSFAQFDEGFFASDEVPGMDMAEVFGCRREFISTRQEIAVRWKQRKLPSRFFLERLIPGTAKVIGTYDDGQPAITMNTFGKGKAVYLGTNLFMDYLTTESAATRAFVMDLNKQIQRSIWTDSVCTFARTLTTPDGAKRMIFLFNGFDRTVKTTFQAREKLGALPDIFNGGKVSFKAQGTGSHVTLTMKPHEVRVLLKG